MGGKKVKLSEGCMKHGFDYIWQEICDDTVQELHKNSQWTIRDCVAYATITVILSKQKTVSFKIQIKEAKTVSENIFSDHSQHK